MEEVEGDRLAVQEGHRVEPVAVVAGPPAADSTDNTQHSFDILHTLRTDLVPHNTGHTARRNLLDFQLLELLGEPGLSDS